MFTPTSWIEGRVFQGVACRKILNFGNVLFLDCDGVYLIFSLQTTYMYDYIYVFFVSSTKKVRSQEEKIK